MVRSFSSYLDSGLVAPSHGWGAMALCLTKHGEKHGHSNEIPKKMREKPRNTNKHLMFLNVEPCWTIYFRNEDCHNSGVWGWNDPQNWCLPGIQWEKMQHITYIYIIWLYVYILYDYMYTCYTCRMPIPFPDLKRSLSAIWTGIPFRDVIYRRP